jgi:hypothetical protein
MSSKGESDMESDMNLIILVERKKILILFFIGNFTILTQPCDCFVVLRTFFKKMSVSQQKLFNYEYKIAIK